MENLVTKLLFLPPVVSEHGPALDNLLLYVHLLMLVLFVGWSAFFLYALWRFRKEKHPQADHFGVRSHASNYLEVGVAVVEAVLLLGFAIPLWARGAGPSHFPAEKDSTVVQVIGRQFNWLTRYPGSDGVFGKGDPSLVTAQNPLGIDPNDPHSKDDITVESSEVFVPVGKPVIIQLSSMDVIHCFAVKPMRITQDAIPGLSIPVWFTATHTGIFQINCAQLCGNGHSNMRGLLHVQKPEEYAAWLKEKSKAGAGSTTSYE